jgi:hypothetical protein
MTIQTPKMSARLLAIIFIALFVAFCASGAQAQIILPSYPDAELPASPLTPTTDATTDAATTATTSAANTVNTAADAATTGKPKRSGQAVVTIEAAQQAAKATAAKQAAAAQRAHRYLNHMIHQAQDNTWRWEHVYGPTRTPASAPEQIKGLSYKRYVLKKWQSRAHEAYLKATNPPNYSSWMCIHHYEGAWNSATGNGYYGGLQMDSSFAGTYGSWLVREKGMPSNWTPLEQIWAAERARASGRGFYPWPNTARMCGLL